MTRSGIVSRLRAVSHGEKQGHEQARDGVYSVCEYDLRGAACGRLRIFRSAHEAHGRIRDGGADSAFSCGCVYDFRGNFAVYDVCAHRDE